MDWQNAIVSVILGLCVIFVARKLTGYFSKQQNKCSGCCDCDCGTQKSEECKK